MAGGRRGRHAGARPILKQLKVAGPRRARIVPRKIRGILREMADRVGGREALKLEEEVTEVDASGVVAAGLRDRQELLQGLCSREEYCERQVERALAPYRALLDAESYEQMREVLLEQLREDPVLQELTERVGAPS